MEAAQLRHEAEHNGGRADKVEQEGIANVAALHRHVVDEIQGDIQEDEQQLQRGKLDGALLVTQVGEGNALNGVHSHHGHHHAHVFGMGFVTQQGSDRLQKHQSQSKKRKRHATYTHQRSGVDAHRIVLAVVGETEEARLHAEGKQHQCQSHPSINICHHAIASALRGHRHGIDRYQQIIQKSPYDTA